MYSFQKNNEKKPHKIQRHNKQILQKDIVKNFSALIPIYNDLSTTPDICVDFFCYANLNFNKIVQSQYFGRYKFLHNLCNLPNVTAYYGQLHAKLMAINTIGGGYFLRSSANLTTHNKLEHTQYPII